MNAKLFEVLDYLNQYTVGTKKDIAPLINKFYPIEENIQMYIYNNQVGDIDRFIQALKMYVDFNTTPQFNAHNSFPTQYLNSFFVSINNQGIQAIENEEQKHHERILNGSALQTNESIIATNKSVLTTNEALIKVSTEQGEINKAIVENSTQQTIILRRQTLIFLFTGIFGLGSLIVGGTTLYRDNSKSTLQIQLQQQSKELQLLRSKIQLMSNKHHAPTNPNKTDTTSN